MKKVLLFLLAFIFYFATGYSQFQTIPEAGTGYFEGATGLNWIDGQLYYSFHIRPEVAFGNFGVGLDLNFDIDRNGNLRKEDFNELSDYLSIIRYVRYGQKYDPVYVKLGALDYYTLGHGSIISLYNNSPSIDSRKIGLVTDINWGNFGFESIYSNFAEAGLVGIRGYVKPLHYTNLSSVPVIGNLEVGATFADDFNNKAGIINGYYDKSKNDFIATYDKGSMEIVGLDLGLPLISTSMFQTTIYTDYSKIINFGSGVATGLLFSFNGLGLVSGSAKLERRFNYGKYIPSYFNSLYEVERFSVDTANGTFTSKAEKLNSITSEDNGYFGELHVNVINMFFIIGSYERLDKTPNSGQLHIEAEAAPESIPFVLRAGYDKINIGAETDIFKLDDRSYLYFEIGYKPQPYLLVSMYYQWTFAPVRDGSNNIIGYTPQKRIEPRITVMFPFNMP